MLNGPPDNRQAGCVLLAVLLAAATLSASLLGLTPWFQIVENFKSDLYQVRLSPFSPPAGDIVIVGFDEATLAGFEYRSPIDRGFLATLISTIDARAPKALALDLLLDTRTEPAKDQQLINALRSATAPIFVAAGTVADGLTDAQVKTQDRFLKGVNRVSVVIARDNFDAVVRHFHVVSDQSGKAVTSLAAAAAGIDDAEVTDTVIRLAYPSNTADRQVTFPAYPANTVSVLPEDWFRDKYVLIGLTTGAADRYRTPFVASWGDELGSLPGVVIHAFALDQLLRGHQVVAVGRVAGGLISVFLCIAGLLLLRAPLPLTLRIGLIGVLIVVYVSATAALYAMKAVLLPVTVPTFALMVCSLSYGIMLWHKDRREKAFIRSAWSQYVSPEIVEDLVANPDRLKLGGEERMVTYLFTDIAGFTSLAEGLPPEKVGLLLNDYLDGIFDLFRAKGGTIDKIVGDAVVGMFGAPVADERQAQNAVELALEIDSFCSRFSAQQNADGIGFGETRLGVNTGMALVGNFGGSRFFDYTGLGDTINTAARLEGANKAFGTRICVSGSTRAEVNGISFRKIGAVSLAGKEILTEAFEPVPEIDKRHLDLYNAAYSEMECGSNKAVGLFKELLAEYPGDRLAERHSARITKTGIVTARIDLLIK